MTLFLLENAPTQGQGTFTPHQREHPCCTTTTGGAVYQQLYRSVLDSGICRGFCYEHQQARRKYVALSMWLLPTTRSKKRVRLAAFASPAQCSAHFESWQLLAPTIPLMSAANPSRRQERCPCGAFSNKLLRLWRTDCCLYCVLVICSWLGW